MTTTTLAAGSSATVALPAGSTLVLAGSGTWNLVAPQPARRGTAAQKFHSSAAVGPFDSAVSVRLVALQAVQYRAASRADVFQESGAVSPQVDGLNSGKIIDSNGGIWGISTVATPGSPISATGSLGLGASGGVLSGFNVSAVTPTATVAVYDATSATGSPIWTFSASAIGILVPAAGMRLALATAGWVVITGTVTLVPLV